MQINLFGNIVKNPLKVNQVKTGNNQKKPALWDGVCCEACWNATENVCTCKCGGVNHGKGLNHDHECLDGFSKENWE